MKSFVACANACMVTLTVCALAVAAFLMFAMLAGESGYSPAHIYDLPWLDAAGSAFIGLTGGFFGAHFDRERPFLTAAVTTALIELLHARITGALLQAPVLEVIGGLVIALAAAMIAAWLVARASFRK